MFSNKTKILISTAVLTVLGVAVTGVASARVNGSRTVGEKTVASSDRRTHDEDQDHHPNRRPHDEHKAHRGGRPPHLRAVTAVLGMASEELTSALRSGLTLADVAASKGVEVKKVIDAIIVDERTEIAKAVADARITQAEADELLSKVEGHATAIVNGEHPEPLFGHRPHRGPTTDHGSDD